MSMTSLKKAAEYYAAELDWELVEADDDQAVFEIESDLENVYNLYMDATEDGVAFSIPSSAVFEKKTDLPHEVSSMLLERNSNMTTGFWALEEFEEGWGYILYYDHKMPNSDYQADLSRDLFEQIVEDMVAECDEFEEIWTSDGEEAEDEE